MVIIKIIYDFFFTVRTRFKLHKDLLGHLKISTPNS